MIRVILVDDEAPARLELKRFLSKISDFQLTGEATNGEEALEMIKELKPDIVFMDIQMPGLNGLEVAGALSEMKNPPLVVFVTAYDQYAIRAFEVNAVDYLLKPYDQERFVKTCDKAKERLRDTPGAKMHLGSLKEYLDQDKPLNIMGHKRGSRDRVFIHPRDVFYFHVSLTEVTAHLAGGIELLLNTTLSGLMEMLGASKFQQTHRAYVVNLEYVEKVTPLFSGNFELILKDPAKTKLPLSRRYAKKLKQYLKW